VKTREITPFGLRMQSELKKKAKESAQLNGRSLNSEINFQLARIYFPGRYKCDKEDGGSNE
jgi:hypothetical protein